MNQWPDLRPVLQGINWAVMSDVATRAYMPERMTQDMDILVHQKDKDAALAKLQQAGYEILQPLAISGYLLRSPEGIEVDVLFRNDSWLKDALNKPVLDAAGYPVIGLPYLTLLKMGAQRTQDWADVSRMLGWADDADLDVVRATVKQYAPEDLEDLESLIFIGKKEQELPPDTYE